MLRDVFSQTLLLEQEAYLETSQLFCENSSMGDVYLGSKYVTGLG